MNTYSYLPDQPSVWSDLLPGGYRERWAPGAFGPSVENIRGSVLFRIHQDHWEKTPSGWERTITRAEILDA